MQCGRGGREGTACAARACAHSLLKVPKLRTSARLTGSWSPLNLGASLPRGRISKTHYLHNIDSVRCDSHKDQVFERPLVAGRQNREHNL